MMKFNFLSTLSGRLLAFGVFPTVLAIGAIVAESTIENRRHMLSMEKQLLTSSVRGVSRELSVRNERWNNVSSMMALAQVHGMFGQRKITSDYVRDVNVIFPLIMGAYIDYEPDADGRDASTLKGEDCPREAIDASGRFVPYWKTVDGVDVLRQRTGMDKTDSYQKSKREFENSGNSIAVVAEPVLRDGITIVTHSFPIILRGKFVGTAGVDRDLRAISEAAENIKKNVGADVFILSAGNRFLSATSDSRNAAAADQLLMKELGMSPYASQAASWLSARPEGDSFEAVDPVLGEPCVYATCTVATGGWTVVIRRTRADVLQTANAAMMRNIMIGGVGLLVVGGLLFAVSRSVSQRVRRAGIGLYSTATEISATSKQQEASASTFGAASSQIAAAVKEISATSKDLVRTMESVSQNAVETAALAGVGRTGLQGMESVMHDLDRATTAIADKLGAINERSQKITTVITTITKVADQTNILSINAAIEAEKAGEFGSGFLVIAREIRRLADQTASATLDIEQMVQQMQAAVSSGVMEMDRFSDQVRRGVRDVASAGTQLTEIIDRVNQSTETFKQVNESMQAQSEGASQISDAMNSLTGNAQQTMQSVQEFGRAAGELQSAIAMLRHAVGEFKE